MSENDDLRWLRELSERFDESGQQTNAAIAHRVYERYAELEKALVDELDNWNPERRPTITAERDAALEALRDVVDAFTRWSENASDGTYARYRADDRLTYWKDDDLMAACLNARKVLSGETPE